MLNVTLDGGGRRMVWLRFRIIGSRREQDLKESWWFAIERRGERRKKTMVLDVAKMEQILNH